VETPGQLWTLDEWLSAAKFSKVTYYRLEPHQKPKQVRVGGKPLIQESPNDWSQRVAVAGEIRTSRQAQAA
jgi:hypothetical protein